MSMLNQYKLKDQYKGHQSTKIHFISEFMFHAVIHTLHHLHIVGTRYTTDVHCYHKYILTEYYMCILSLSYQLTFLQYWVDFWGCVTEERVIFVTYRRLANELSSTFLSLHVSLKYPSASTSAIIKVKGSLILIPDIPRFQSSL